MNSWMHLQQYPHLPPHRLSGLKATLSWKTLFQVLQPAFHGQAEESSDQKGLRCSILKKLSAAMRQESRFLSQEEDLKEMGARWLH